MREFQTRQRVIFCENRRFRHAFTRVSLDPRLIQEADAAQRILETDHKRIKALIRGKNVRSCAENIRLRACCGSALQQLLQLLRGFGERHDCRGAADAEGGMAAQRLLKPVLNRFAPLDDGLLKLRTPHKRLRVDNFFLS